MSERDWPISDNPAFAGVGILRRFPVKGLAGAFSASGDTERLDRAKPACREVTDGAGIPDGMAAHTAFAFDIVRRYHGEDLMDCRFAHAKHNAKSLSKCLANKSALRQNSWQASIGGMKDIPRPFADIAARLLWHRTLVKMNQDEYAAQIDFKRSAYSLWEAGTHRMSIDGGLALRKRWGLSLDFMYDGIDDALPMTLRNAWLERPEVSSSRKSIVNPES